MMKLKGRFDVIRSEILDSIIPTEDENQKISLVVSEISRILEEWNESHEKYSFAFISPQGSTGIKQTHLRNDSDIDLFIFLDPDKYQDVIDNKSKSRTKISALFRKYCDEWIIPALQANKIEEFYIAYAEHPYVSSKLHGYDIDIVFSFILPEEYIRQRGPITAVDRTYYHSKFVKDNLNFDQINDVRILKMFFKNNYSYGDKAAIARGGFIGYAAELFIHHFGDIWNLFTNFEDLPYNGIDFFNRSNRDLREISRFQNDFLILIDPTDSNRNVAASISERAWIYCKSRIQKFLANPNTEYIKGKNLSPLIDKFNKELNSHYVVIELVQISDSHYTKIRDKVYSIAESIKSLASWELDHSIRFPSVNYSIYFNPDNKRFSLTFYTSKFQISEKYIRRGPRADKTRNFEKFEAKHPDLFIKEGFSYVKERRKFIDFLTMVRSGFKERIFKEIELRNISIPSSVTFKESLTAIHVLKECILPYQEELDQLVHNLIPKKNTRKR
jgi:tRNA nucleotidyltransferase (CCA-adding enzyme)